MKSICIIEDNENIRWELREFFQKNGYQTLCPPDPDTVESLLSAQPADLILLDINLENGRDGFELCRNIRRFSPVPIIFVTGRDSEEDEMRGLRLGGDDYIRKPYSLPVLLMRVRRLLERSQNPPQSLSEGPLTLHILRSQLQYGTNILDLTGNELRIVYFLWIHRGQPVSRDSIIEYLWENKLYVDENILNVNLSRLRKRLEGAGLHSLIQTIPRQGYLLRIPEDYV